MPIIADDQTLLAIATTGLRDLYMGYAPRELVAPSGESGLDALLVELVTDLRGRGVDDDGGWNTAITEEIPVADENIPLGDDAMIDDLALATTALRDLRENWPHDEIAAPDNGKGLGDLIRHLVTRLRAAGIDDDGGWDCDVTQGIPVAGGTVPAA